MVMTAVMETASERVTILMTPTEKSALETKAREAGVSAGEYVRRSVDAYDPEMLRDLAQLDLLAAELRRSTAEANDALDRALASYDAMREQLDRKLS
jgi:hypothetical protein